MHLPKFLKREPSTTEAAGVAKPEPAALVQARRRLMGAAVLLAVGVVVFPLLFDSKPRPLPANVPLEYAPTALRSADPGPPAAASPGRPSVSPVPSPMAASPALAVEPVSRVEDTGPVVAKSPLAGDSAPTEDAVEAEPVPVASVAAAAEPPPTPADRPQAAPNGAPLAKPAPPARPPGVQAVRPAGEPNGTAPAETPKPAAATRYIVQVGAFADPATAREVRLKVERLGFVTYTHVIKVPDGQRIRVRVGPMADRAQAQRTLDKIRQAGLPGALLTL